MKVLVTGVGGPTPRSFVRSITNYGNLKNIEFIGTDINPFSIGLYQKNLFSHRYVIPKASDSKYWETIEMIVSKHDIGFAIILPELEVLEWSKRKLDKELPCKVLLPDYDLAKSLVNKAKMSEILEETDLVPTSIEFSRDEKNLAEIAKSISYPYWVRSTSGSSGLGSLKIYDIESLKNWIQINPTVKQFIASTYLPGRNLACKLLYFNGKLLRSAVAERVNYIMSKVAPSGITGNTSFGRLINEPNLVKMAEGAMELMFKKTNSSMHGFFTVDFKEDASGKPYITEINVRHVAFTQCFAAGGANFAEDTLRLLNEDPDFEREPKIYQFEEGLIFLRDVDERPILMNEKELLKKWN